MRIIPNYKTLGIAGMFMLGSGIFASCQIRVPKPDYDITITEHHPGYANGKNSIPAKIEDGCSYETFGKKYIMLNGNLLRFDKKTKTLQETDTMDLSFNGFEDFEEVAKFCNEHGDTICLSARDIEIAKDRNPEWCQENDNFKDGKGIIKSTNTIERWRGIFKYDDTDCNPHKW